MLGCESTFANTHSLEDKSVFLIDLLAISQPFAIVSPKNSGSIIFNKMLSIPPTNIHSIFSASIFSINPALARDLNTSPLPLEPVVIE